MQTSAPTAALEKRGEGSLARREGSDGGFVSRMLAYLPRGNTLDDKAWNFRHTFLKWVLLLHLPFVAIVGVIYEDTLIQILVAMAGPAAFLVAGHVFRARRVASSCVTGGLVLCSGAFAVLTYGLIEAHFHFFIIIGFIALYQDWVPFLWNVAFTAVSHGIGTGWIGNFFNHPAAQTNPWLWAILHAALVLVACAGMVIFWRITEDEQTAKERLSVQLVTADAEIGRRRFTSDMLVNLARRNQSMLYRQLDIINALEEKERDPDTLAELFTLDHLATRVRRNAESLLVLSGEQPPRTWSAPVPLRDVVRAAIAETEDLDRVVFAIDEQVSVSGGAVADLTHLLAELTENAVRFSPPDTAVTIRARPDRRDDGGYLLTIEDWGVGMPPDDLDSANTILDTPREVDLAVAQRLGFHVVSRLAARHAIKVSLGPTPGTGVTAVVALPGVLFAPGQVASTAPPAPLRQAVQPEPNRFGGGTGPTREPHFGRPEGARGDDPNTTWMEPVGTATGREDVPAQQTPAWTQAVAATPAVPVDDPAPAPGPGDEDWRGWWSPETADSAGGFGPAPTIGNGHAGNNGGGLAPETAATRQQLQAVPATASSPSPRPRPVGSDIPEQRPPESAGRPAATERPTDSGGKPGLRRRVPQASLVPELRQAPASAEPDFAVTPDSTAASALSRYQASRQAAQTVVNENSQETEGRHS